MHGYERPRFKYIDPRQGMPVEIRYPMAAPPHWAYAGCMIRKILFALALLAVSAASAAGASRPAVAPASPSLRDLLARLHAAAPDANPAVLAIALEARECATREGAAPASSRFAVIDYSRPSTQRRLWVFDINHAQLLFAEYVAHGKGSGDNLASTFSNRDSSHQSSLGLFTTAETYLGDNGYSLRMDGLEPGFNDNARARAIVMHGAAYVDPLQALRQGRLGRSFGCPALRPQVARAVIDSIKQGQLLFAYYPDQRWLTGSNFITCGAHANALSQR